MMKYIALGTDCKEFFNYDGKPLPIRPLSTYELDRVFIQAVEGVSSFIFDSVIKLKLGLVKSEQEIDLNKNNYRDLLTYFNEIDYWTVYFAMKDFQPEDFSMPDFSKEFRDEFEDWDENKPKGYYCVRKMKYVHRLSSDIMSMTIQPSEQLVEVMTNTDGKTLASLIHRFHQPLASEAWKLTPLQVSFIYYTRDGAPIMLKSIKDLPGITRAPLKDIMQKFKDMGMTDG